MNQGLGLKIGTQDTYLKSKDGEMLFTVRSDNWNEKLGVVSADDVALVAGVGDSVRPRTLRSVLEGLGELGSYAGLAPGCSLSDVALDAKCSIRFQTTFIPVQRLGGGAAKLEFATEAFNYNTMDDSDPRNLVLLCTSQGMAVQQDGSGAKKLFHHAVDGDGLIHRYWLEAEESRHQVGGEQRETAEERAIAQARGKATSSVIGIGAMGQRFNVLMTIQVPLKQQHPCDYDLDGCELCDCDEAEDCEDSFGLCESRCHSQSYGVSSAARVSRGSEYDVWPGLSVTQPERHPAEHVTITVVMYNAVQGGVPTADDVAAAIDDLEMLYQSCQEHGMLGDDVMSFMKAPLTIDDLTGIASKLHSLHEVFPA